MIYGSFYCNELYANMDCSNILSSLNQNTAEKNIQPDSFRTHTHTHMHSPYMCLHEDQVWVITESNQAQMFKQIN